MTHINQPDLFGDDQPQLFDAEAAPPVTRADPQRVRARLRLIIAEARTARRLPWDARKLRLYRTIVPQMTFGCPRTRRRNCASSSRRSWRGSRPHEPAFPLVIPVTTGIQH